MAHRRISIFTVCTVLLDIKAILCWPGGNYGLPMTKSGCPDGNGFVWFTGSRTHQTEAGSFCSEGNHFSGECATEQSPADRITQYFCLKKKSTVSENNWKPGQYCVYRVGPECPDGFEKGSLHWDDNVSLIYEISDHPVQTTTGDLPAGVYDTNTEIKYCCRGDGAVTKPITLPAETPFYLVRLGTECQEVEGMTYSVETMQWAGDHKTDYDTGVHPLHTHTSKYSRVYYCYYQPIEKSTTTKTIILAVLGVVAFIILIAIVVFIVQRFLAIKKLKALEESENNNSDPMIGNKPVSVIYRPGKGKKKTTAPADEEGGLLPTAPSDSRPDSIPPSYEEAIGQ